MRTLLASDALIALLTEDGLRSPSVLGEIGTARAMELTQGMLILPILCGVTVPDFIRELWCFELSAVDDDSLDALVSNLDAALADSARLAPKLFVSHQHKDRSIAIALTTLLESAFDLKPNDIRCTSVAKYSLTPGARTSEQLRSDIAGAQLVIGILGPDTSASNYVLDELGAAWARDVPTFPLLVRGARFEQIPSPFNERHSLSLDQEATCLQLLDYVKDRASLRRFPMSEEIALNARKLAEAAVEGDN